MLFFLLIFIISVTGERVPADSRAFSYFFTVQHPHTGAEYLHNQQQHAVAGAPLSLLRSAVSRDSLCSSNSCGPNTDCVITDNGGAQCRCKEGYIPNPSSTRGCVAQCYSNNGCPQHQICSSPKCVDVCTSTTCGDNADCQAYNHVAGCVCKDGFTGDAVEGCESTVIVPPRENNTETTGPGSTGKPCHDPYPCGQNTNCHLTVSGPVCSCIDGYLGNPKTGCKKVQCTQDSHCEDTEKCHNNKCISPCELRPCGRGAVCRDQNNHQPICSCPPGKIGNPHQRCMDPVELCNPNPCGVDAICKPGKDSAGRHRPVCSCPTGYIGDARFQCRRECVRDSECAYYLSCNRNYRCVDPCKDACGLNTRCRANNHVASCSCLPGYRGNAFHGCYRAGK